MNIKTAIVVSNNNIYCVVCAGQSTRKYGVHLPIFGLNSKEADKTMGGRGPPINGLSPNMFFAVLQEKTGFVLFANQPIQ